jgi:hypothetical protein
LEQVANDVAVELADGFDMTDIRSQDGREPDKAFQPCMIVLTGILEHRVPQWLQKRDGR